MHTVWHSIPRDVCAILLCLAVSASLTFALTAWRWSHCVSFLVLQRLTLVAHQSWFAHAMLRSFSRWVSYTEHAQLKWLFSEQLQCKLALRRWWPAIARGKARLERADAHWQWWALYSFFGKFLGPRGGSSTPQGHALAGRATAPLACSLALQPPCCPW